MCLPSHTGWILWFYDNETRGAAWGPCFAQWSLFPLCSCLPFWNCFVSTHGFCSGDPIVCSCSAAFSAVLIPHRLCNSPIHPSGRVGRCPLWGCEPICTRTSGKAHAVCRVSALGQEFRWKHLILKALLDNDKSFVKRGFAFKVLSCSHCLWDVLLSFISTVPSLNS